MLNRFIFVYMLYVKLKTNKPGLSQKDNLSAHESGVKMSPCMGFGPKVWGKERVRNETPQCVALILRMKKILGLHLSKQRNQFS